MNREAMLQRYPEAAHLLKNYQLSDEEVLEKLAELLATNLAPVEKLGPSDLPGELFDNKVGLTQLNPLTQAAIVERLQYDGDLPDLRTSDLPPGNKPAVPVASDARSAVALGVMLETASDEVEAQVREHQIQRSAHLLEKGASWLEKAEKDPDFLRQAGGCQSTDLALYRRGEAPAPIQVEKPSGSALAALTLEERRSAAFKFLSTTQGRRSAVATLQELIADQLAELEVVGREFDPEREVRIQAHHTWEVNLHGKGAVKETFSLINTASQALSVGLAQALPSDYQGPLYLEVIPKNTVDVRSVGWSARLVS